jgi:hypothetical protein
MLSKWSAFGLRGVKPRAESIMEGLMTQTLALVAGAILGISPAIPSAFRTSCALNMSRYWKL